jgi:hypothetical protein
MIDRVAIQDSAVLSYLKGKWRNGILSAITFALRLKGPVGLRGIDDYGGAGEAGGFATEFP